MPSSLLRLVAGAFLIVGSILAGCAGVTVAPSTPKALAKGSTPPVIDECEATPVPVPSIGTKAASIGTKATRRTLCGPVGTHAAGSPIKHVIIIYQENRSFDNLFGNYCPYVRAAATCVNTVQTNAGPNYFEDPWDPSHDRGTLLTEYNGGAMNGFASNVLTAPPALDAFLVTYANCENQPTPTWAVCMAQAALAVDDAPGGSPPPNYIKYQVPVAEASPYYDMAATFGVADNMYASQMAPSYPAHLYIVAGQSGRIVTDPATNFLVPLPIGTPYDLTNDVVWGCDSNPATTVQVLLADNTTIGNPESPCINVPSLANTLSAYNVSWKFYTGPLITLNQGLVDLEANTYNGANDLRTAAILDPTNSSLDSIQSVRYNTGLWQWVVPNSQVINDINTNQLPAVSWITPPNNASDHAGYYANLGPAWVQTIVSAVLLNPNYRDNTAIFVTWDDPGGWYDHVAPPRSFPNGQSDGISYGFRVPLITISAWNQRGGFPGGGSVDHTQHDFGSILNFIESNWNLPYLGSSTVDVFADNLSSMFTFNFSATAPPASQSVSDMALLKFAQTHPGGLTVNQILNTSAALRYFPLDGDRPITRADIARAIERAQRDGPPQTPGH